MKQMIAKYLITRAIDDGRALPNWLERVVNADLRLQQYESEQRQLITRLRSESNAWAIARKPATQVEPNKAPAHNTTSKWAAAALAVCACSLLGAAMYFGSQPTTLPGPVAEATTPKPFEPEDVNKTLLVGREWLGGIATDFDRFSNIVPPSTPDEIGKLTKDYVQEAGTIFGRGLALLDQSGH
ncbi:MAG: hypothetical protein AB8G99_15615 [Planctomycetaceae bacterium]